MIISPERADPFADGELKMKIPHILVKYSFGFFNVKYWKGFKRIQNITVLSDANPLLGLIYVKVKYTHFLITFIL